MENVEECLIISSLQWAFSTLVYICYKESIGPNYDYFNIFTPCCRCFPFPRCYMFWLFKKKMGEIIKLLHDHVNTVGAEHQETKSDFINQTCEVWTLELNKQNIVSGFDTGILKQTLLMLLYQCNYFSL